MTVTRLAVAEASARMLAGVGALEGEHVSLPNALGRVLAEDVVSPVSLPPWDNASMDGFAVRSGDVRGATPERPVRLRVVATIAAGHPASRAIGPGEAARIMTGAPVPPDADAVIRVEDSDDGAELVAIHDDRDLGRNIRPRGEDVRAGTLVLGAGTLLRPAHLGVLASVGRAGAVVHRRPRVAILATGDELVPIEQFDEVRAGNRIVSSNSYALEAAVRAAGGEPRSLGIAADDPSALAERLRTAEGCDLVLTSGGVSVGDYDYTRAVVQQLGGTLAFWRVRMRPGAPLGFGQLLGMPWLGLPGNPVSALVTFELFGRPLLRLLGGHRRPHRRTIRVVIDEPLHLAAPLTHYLRATLTADPEGDDGMAHARLTGSQSSGILTSMSSADVLLVVPPEPVDLPAGTVLRAIALDADLGGSTEFPS